MRTFKQIYRDYTKWLVKKTGKQEYLYKNLVEQFGEQTTEVFLYKNLLRLFYDKKNGLFYFCKFMIGDLKDIGYPTSFRYNGLLRKWNKLVIKHKNLCIEAARGHGKTVFFSQVLSIYDMFLHKFRRIILISSNQEQSNDILENIKLIVDNNEWLSTKKEKFKWAATRIGYNGGYIMAAGISTEILGQHVDRIVLDDILRTDNQISDQQIEDYIDMNLLPMILSRNGQLILVGTPKGANDIFARISQRIKDEPKSTWKFYKFPAILDYEKKSLQCPDRFTWESIMEKRLTMGSLKFSREYQLEFFSRDKSLFQDAIRQPAKDKGQELRLLHKADNRGNEWIYTMGCLPDGEKVLTNKGEKNVEDVWKKNIKLYDRNYNLTNIKNYQRRKYNDFIYEITPSHTKISTKMTKEHPVLILRNEEKKFVEAKDLKIGDLLIFPKKIKGTTDIDDNYPKGSGNKSIPLDFINTGEFGRFIGLYLAEGWIGYGNNRSNRNINLHLGKHEKELIKFVKYFIVDKLKRKPYVHFRDNCCSISFHNKWLYNFLKDFGRYAYGKYIPLYYKFSKEFKKGLIIGYWKGDGCLKYDKRRKYRIINFVSTSKLLLTNIQHLLYELGIETRLKILRKNGSYKFKEKSHISKIRETYELETSAQEYNKFIKILNLKEYKYNDINIKYSGKRKFSPIISKNEVYIPIEKINKTFYNGFVNNFETEEHTYMNYNLISHNCDVARSGSASADYTVAIVLAYNSVTQTKQIVHMWREKGLKITNQAAEIARIAKNFDNCQVLVEKNNVGQDMIDTLADEWNVGVESFTTGGKGQKKEELIRFLITAFEHEQIVMPYGDDWSKEQMNILDDELSKFCSVQTPAGNEQFKGLGGHDDTVMALALANKATQVLGVPFAVTNFGAQGSGTTRETNPYGNLVSKDGDETDLVKLIRMGVIK